MSIARLRSSPASPASAPKPTSTWPLRSTPPSAARTSSVGSSVDAPGLVVLRRACRRRLRGPVVGDRGRHHDDVGAAARGRSPRVRGRPRSASRRPRRPPAPARRGSPRAASPPLRGAAPPRRARRPSGPRSGCRGSGRSRAARACRRRSRARACRRGALPSRGPSSSLGPARDLLRLAHPAEAGLALGELAFLRSRRARCLARAEAPRFACVAGCSHMRVFIAGRDERRPRVRERRLGEDVVGEPVRELRERVRGQRRDDEQVGALEMRVRVGGSAACARARRTSRRGRSAPRPASAAAARRGLRARAGAAPRTPCRPRCRR